MKIETVSYAERRALGETLGATLDGKPAAIHGYAREFATVRVRGTNESVEFSWPTVARIMKKDKAFKS